MLSYADMPLIDAAIRYAFAAAFDVVASSDTPLPPLICRHDAAT